MTLSEQISIHTTARDKYLAAYHAQGKPQIWLDFAQREHEFLHRLHGEAFNEAERKCNAAQEVGDIANSEAFFGEAIDHLTEQNTPFETILENFS